MLVVFSDGTSDRFHAYLVNIWKLLGQKKSATESYFFSQDKTTDKFLAYLACESSSGQKKVQLNVGLFFHMEPLKFSLHT